MTQNIYDLAYSLANSIKESDEFKRYKLAKEKIDKDEKLKQMVEDFKKKQIDLEQKRLQGQDIKNEDIYALEKLYQIISLNPDIEKYLSSEMMLFKILSDISKILADALEIKDWMI